MTYILNNGASSGQSPARAFFSGPWYFVALPPITWSVLHPRHRRTTALGCVYFHTHFASQAKPHGPGRSLVPHLPERQPFCCSSHTCPQQSASSSPSPLSPCCLLGSFHALLLRGAATATPQGRNPEGGGLGPLRACFILHPQMDKGEPPGSVLARQGTMDSAMPCRASRRAKLGRQQQWLGLETSGLSPSRCPPQGKDGVGGWRE